MIPSLFDTMIARWQRNSSFFRSLKKGPKQIYEEKENKTTPESHNFCQCLPSSWTYLTWKQKNFFFMPLTLGVKTIECKIMQIWNCWAAPSWWSGKSPKLLRNVTNNYLADREFNVARKECKQNVFFQPFFVTRLILGKSDVFLCKVKYPTFDNWHFSLLTKTFHRKQ